MRQRSTISAERSCWIFCCLAMISVLVFSIDSVVSRIESERVLRAVSREIRVLLASFFLT